MPTTECGCTTVNAQTWPWAVSPPNSGSHNRMNLHLSTMHFGGITDQLVLRSINSQLERKELRVQGSPDTAGRLLLRVGQAFGTIKRRLHLARARYFGAAKVQAQMRWAALEMSRLKADCAHSHAYSGRCCPEAKIERLGKSSTN